MEAVPGLDVGVNLLETSAHRTTALHQIALSHLDETGGLGIWFDARGNASTYLLAREFHAKPNLEIARAFTAYQHYELIRTLPGDIPRNTELVVCPCVTSLYRDDDVPDWEGEKYLESALAILDETATVTGLPILVSCVTDTDLIGVVREVATQTITVEKTGLGYRFELLVAG